MGHGALNQGVSKIEIPGKSQMALTTDKWLSLAPFAPYRRFMHPLIKSTINSYTARIWTARSVKRHTANNGLAPELRGKDLIRSNPDQMFAGIGQRNLEPTFQMRPFFRF